MPDGNDVVVICNDAGETVSVNVLDAVVPTESLIVKLIGKFPGTVGVPEICPCEFMDRFDGNAEAVHVYGGLPPAPSIVNPYATLTVAGARAELITRSGPP